MNRDTLIELLSCPIDWQSICPEPEFVGWLDFGWYATCVRHQIDREASFNFTYENFAPSSTSIEELDDVEFFAALHNVRQWNIAARDEFLSFYRRFVQLSAVGAEIYRKHYSARSSSPEEIASKSATHGASILLPYITTAVQERLLWASLAQLTWQVMSELDNLERFSSPEEAELKFRDLFGKHSIIIATDFCRPVGASAGQPTQFACIDIDFSTPQFHIYPVSKSEYECAKPQCRVQGWNYGLQP